MASTILVTLPAPVLAQWIQYRTPDRPRLADGTPDLEAPVRRLDDGRPDLQGVWRAPWEVVGIMPPTGVLQPWAATLMQKRREAFHRERPSNRCLPSGPEANEDTLAFLRRRDEPERQE